jgi:hypothetical protein
MRLDELYCGFRERYLDYEALTRQVRGWAEAFPELLRLESIATTPEGRDLWLLTIGPEPDRVRPGVWVDGNMHAVELAGSSVALQIAEDVLRLHTGGDEGHGLPPHVRERLREVLFYVLPRISPDGAEAVLDTGRYVRSVPRDQRPARQHPRWIAGDVDGDGLSLLMRVQDPTGEFTEAPEIPGLLVTRRLEDPGPFYKVYPEGHIENFDGHTVPTPNILSDNQTDLNRNFPWSWAPDHQQLGAGSYPMSEPESRAVVETTSRLPHLYAWLNLHTFGGVFIRPLGNAPDNKMNPGDLALFRQIEAWAEELTGYPMVSGFEEFTYEPDRPLHGDLSDYAFHQRGCISYVVELWDLFKQIGMEKKKRFVDLYTQVSRDQMIALARWDREHNRGRSLVPWRKVRHPQLGPVEVGGLDPRVGISNPPYERLPEVCQTQSACFLRVAALAPALRVGEPVIERLGGELTRVSVEVENQGYLPTFVLGSARELSHNEPLYAEVSVAGCELAEDAGPRREVGHLEGWGRGLYDGTGALYFLRSRGSTGRARVSYVVRGRGTLTLTVGSCRVGWVSRAVSL